MLLTREKIMDCSINKERFFMAVEFFFFFFNKNDNFTV